MNHPRGRYERSEAPRGPLGEKRLGLFLTRAGFFSTHLACTVSVDQQFCERERAVAPLCGVLQSRVCEHCEDGVLDSLQEMRIQEKGDPDAFHTDAGCPELSVLPGHR